MSICVLTGWQLSGCYRGCLLSLTIMALLAVTGCDSGNSEPGNLTPDPVDDDQSPLDVNGPSTTITADETQTPLPAGNRARVYTGEFDSGTGVFLLDAQDRLIGLVDGASESINSVRVDLDGDTVATVQQFIHLSENSNAGYQLYPFGESAGPATDITLEVIDGQRISSLTSTLPINLTAAADTLLPISASALRGNWTGAYQLCDSQDQHCAQFLLKITLDQDTLTGSSHMLAADGTDLLPSTVSGSVAQRGIVLDVSFTWNTYRYEGFAFVSRDSSNQLNLVATTDSEIADERILASTLVRLQ